MRQRRGGGQRSPGPNKDSLRARAVVCSREPRQRDEDIQKEILKDERGLKCKILTGEEIECNKIEETWKQRSSTKGVQATITEKNKFRKINYLKVKSRKSKF